MSSYTYFKHSTQTNRVVLSTLSELSYKYSELFMFLVLVSTILIYFLGKMNKKSTRNSSDSSDVDKYKVVINKF